MYLGVVGIALRCRFLTIPKGNLLIEAVTLSAISTSQSGQSRVRLSRGVVRDVCRVRRPRDEEGFC